MRYIVNGKCVIAIMDNVPSMIAQRLRAKLQKASAGTRFSRYADLMAYGIGGDLIFNTFKDKYRGIAKCHPDDKFDLEVGKELARIRALEKFERDVKKFENDSNYLAMVFNLSLADTSLSLRKDLKEMEMD